MRAVFLALLSANLLFLAWAYWVDTPRASSAQDALSRLPRLQLVTETPAAPEPASGMTQKMSLREQPPALNCSSVGPFNDITSAARASAMLAQRGLKPLQRAEEGETLEGFWVFVGGMETEDDLARVLQKLEKSGFTDAHVMKSSAAGRRVSVGLFSQRERAEHRAAAIRQMGLDPQIGERKFPGTVYWVDVALQPGVRELPAQWLLVDANHPKVGVQSCPPGSAAQPAEPASPEPADDGDGITTSLPRTTVAGAPRLP